MEVKPPNKRHNVQQIMIKRLSLLGLILAFLVVVFGSFVRLSDAGLGCPDWPGCYGHMVVPHTEEAQQKALQKFPLKEVDVAKAWIEMAHRYLAGTLGLLILAIAFISWRIKAASRTLTTILLGVVMLQAMLGMWTVTMLLKPAIVTLHLLGGMTTLSLLLWLTLRQGALGSNVRRTGFGSYQGWAVLGLILLCIQISLGGWVSTNYAALACADFPLCQSQWLPTVDFHHAFQIVRDLGMTAAGDSLSKEALTAIHWSHRVGALITFVYLLIFGVFLMQVSALKFYAKLMFVFLFTQVSLGIANVVLSLPLAMAVAHNATAALLLGSVVIINFILSRPHSNAIPS